MRKYFIHYLVLCGILLISGIASAQNVVKLGVVDSEMIVKQMPEAQDADKVMKEMQKNYSDTLQKMQGELEARYQQYQKQQGMMAADQKQKEEEALKALQQQFLQYREGIYTLLQQKQDELTAPILAKVKTAIEAVAKDQKISIVIDKKNPSVLYSEDQLDITFKVLDKIKTGGK